MPQRPPRQRLSSNALVLIDPSKFRIVGNSEVTTTAVRRICSASGAKQVTVPKMYPRGGNGAIVGLLGNIRINNLRFFNTAE
jgi:hypothetical protein